MGYSRIILLARIRVQLTILNNMMSDNLPVIWVKVSARGRKSLVIGGAYREFHQLLQPSPNTSNDWNLQITRWRLTLRDWKRASINSKCILLGDLNVDYMRWNDQEYRLKRLIQMMKEEIIPLGFCQLVDKVTRSWPGQPCSLVDQVWTNSPQNIMSTSNTVRASSDHNVLTVILRTKDRMSHQHDMVRRDRRFFDLERFKLKIKNYRLDRAV